MGRAKAVTTTKKSTTVALIVDAIDRANNQLWLVPDQASQLTDDQPHPEAQINTSPIMLTLPSVEGYNVADRVVMSFEL